MCSSNPLSGKRVYRIKDLQSSPWKSGCIPFKKPESQKASLVPQLVKNLPATQETQVWFLGREDPLEREMATHSSILAWRIPVDRGAWRATVHGVARVRHNWVTKPPPPWLIRADLWQKPNRHCKAITLQLKINNFLKEQQKREIKQKSSRFRPRSLSWCGTTRVFRGASHQPQEICWEGECFPPS